MARSKRLLAEYLRVPLIVPYVGDEEVAAVSAVLRRGQLAQGPEVAAFEAEFAAEIGVGHAVAMNSGTAANHSALEALEIGPGDDVLTTPFTFAATATPILMQRANVRFADIDETTFNLTREGVVAALTPRTKAVITVDLFGLPADVTSADLESHGIAVVDDACQAVGATLRGRKAGALGAIGTFSFYATKNIMTGEGGMLVTDDANVAERARRFRQHGMSALYQYTTLGYNYRMTDMAAAIGRVQLRRLQDLNEKRRLNAAFYDEHLGGLSGLRTPIVPAGLTHVYHQYSILVDGEGTPNGTGRDALKQFLAEREIGAGIYYPKPLHLHALFSAGYGPGDFPVSERIAGQILALPVHPALSREQLETVVRAVREGLGAN